MARLHSAAAASLRKHVPQSRLAEAAFELALETLDTPLLHHSLRTFLFAKWIADREGSTYGDQGLDSLFVACLFHDFGATEEHNHSERFEVCGADAAVTFLRGFSHPQAQSGTDYDDAEAVEDGSSAPTLSDSQIWDIWAAIALHTSPGIAERIHPLVRLVRLGVLLDFGKARRAQFSAHDYGNQIEAEVPRLEIEKVLGDAVVQQAVSKKDPVARREKAPATSWAGVLLRSHLEDPTWDGVNRAFG
ncbi:hypothetical protein DV735_g850, partial [Chaetothyriales sp. CBS 134920]